MPLSPEGELILSVIALGEPLASEVATKMLVDQGKVGLAAEAITLAEARNPHRRAQRELLDRAREPVEVTP